MADENKHGLSRSIPAGIRREIRQRCGFGCVVCGLGIYDYEHFDPEFSEAYEHDPKGMTLLCMQCNQKKRRGLLSVDTVKAMNERPKALEMGFAQEWLDSSTAKVEVVFAGCKFTDCTHIVMIDKIPVLSVIAPEENGAPYRISGRFCNDQGSVVLQIEENNWRVCKDSWDVEWAGSKVTVRNGLGDIALVLRSVPPGKIFVEKINMTVNGWTLQGDERNLNITNPFGLSNSFMKGNFKKCFVGIALGAI